MICRVFILDSHNLWLESFRYKLSVMGWEVQFAINLNDFKIRFVESETDILILRGMDDRTTFNYLRSMFDLRPSCGLIWIYPGHDRFSSPYFSMADHRVPLETSDIELIAIAESLFKSLKRWGWR